MATITIDGKEYDLDTMSVECKGQLDSLRYVDLELNRLKARAAALETARIAYGRALKRSLEEGEAPKDDEVNIEGLGETIQFVD